MANASSAERRANSPFARVGMKSDLIFVGLCAAVYCAVVAVWPSYYPIIEPDSAEYLDFSYLRTSVYPLFLRCLLSLGLTTLQITHVQLALFGVALCVLLVALRRVSLPRWMAVAVAVALMNPLFAGYHRVILTESIFASVTVAALAAWIEYFRTSRVVWLAVASLLVGVLIGIRPAAIGLAPALIISWWMNRPKQRAAVIVAFVAAIAPLLVAVAAERSIYKIEQSRRAIMIPYGYLPNTTAAEAAMIIESGMTFTGPHALLLEKLAQTILEQYAPVQKFVAGVPTIVGRANVEAVFEVTAIAIALDDLFQKAATSAGTTAAQLRMEFGKQVIAQNLSGYVKLVLLHYIGQWAVAAPNFPPISRAINAYVEQAGPVPLSQYVPQDAVRPKASLYSVLFFPPFAVMGVVTLIMSLVLLWRLVRPARVESHAPPLFEIATLFALMCQTYTVLISCITFAQPRYLMAVYPQLVLVAALCFAAVWRRWTPATFKAQRENALER